MKQDFFIRESANLSYSEILERLQAVSMAGRFTDERHAHIYRQIVTAGITSMSDRQWCIFRQEMVPLTVDKCCITGCTNPTWPGLIRCPAHQTCSEEL